MPENEIPSNDLRPGPVKSTIDSDSSLPSPEEILGSESRDSVWPGSSLDWSSPLLPVKIYVELPFWLLTPADTFDVPYSGTAFKVKVVHGCEEIQLTTTHLMSRHSTVYIAEPNESVPEGIQRRIERSGNGCSARIHRTTLILEAAAMASALGDPTDSKGQSDALVYLAALASGYFPIVNQIITAYRRAACDPFVQEVTEATVPIWFVKHNDRFIRIGLYPYADQEYRFHWPTEAGVQEPADFSTSSELREFLNLKETPGETILQDSWSYFYAGRFSDAIRGLVTAIEVLLERKYYEALIAHERNDELANKRLSETAQKFTTRLNHYLHLTKRTVPGPMLSWVHYILGTYLRTELNQTRTLRHKIVHKGHRVDPIDHGPMLRSMETMTWLFDWLEDHPRSSRNRFKFYELKTYLKGRRSLFETEYTDGCVKVVDVMWNPAPKSDDQSVEEIPFADELIERKYDLSLFGQEKDFVLFSKLSLACLLAGHADLMNVLTTNDQYLVLDVENRFEIACVRSERFWVQTADCLMAVFLLEIDGELTVDDLSGMLVRLLQLRVEFPKQRVHGFAIVNHQQHLEPELRNCYTGLSDDLIALLKSCDISLAFSSDIARLLRAARVFDWKLSETRRLVFNSGFVPCQPPHSSHIGIVLRIFPRKSVIGVDVDSDSPLLENDKILVMSGHGFQLTDILSIMQGNDVVTFVSHGQVGLKISGNAKLISPGAFVYRFSPPKVSVSPKPIVDPSARSRKKSFRKSLTRSLRKSLKSGKTPAVKMRRFNRPYRTRR